MMHACTDGPQAMDACCQSSYILLKTNYKVIVIISS